MFCFRKFEYTGLATDSTRSMCKICQSCLETIYWHLIEKRFCYDESIAMYEEPPCKEKEKNNNQFDNIAFYDSVAIIAGRAVVTIDPIPPKKEEKETIIVKQPTKSKVRFEPIECAENRSNEEKLQKVTPNIVVQDEKANSDDDLEDDVFKPNTETKPPENNFKIKPALSSSLPDLIDTGNSEKKGNLLAPEAKERKKSLRERRQSKCASLNFENILRGDIPMIKQNSMPKFYIDTPDPYQIDSSILRGPSNALSSPVVPNKNGFEYDLKSVVERQNQINSSTTSLNCDHRPHPLKKNPSIARILNKLPLKKHASAHNLPNTAHHI